MGFKLLDREIKKYSSMLAYNSRTIRLPSTTSKGTYEGV